MQQKIFHTCFIFCNSSYLSVYETRHDTSSKHIWTLQILGVSRKQGDFKFFTSYLYLFMIILYFNISFTISYTEFKTKYEGVYKSYRTDRLELELVQLSATRCSCIAILWVSVVGLAAITLCVASQRVFVVCFVIESVWKLLDTSSYL
jgi:hypothetical protein